MPASRSSKVRGAGCCAGAPGAVEDRPAAGPSRGRNRARQAPPGNLRRCYRCGRYRPSKGSVPRFENRRLFLAGPLSCRRTHGNRDACNFTGARRGSEELLAEPVDRRSSVRNLDHAGLDVCALRVKPSFAVSMGPRTVCTVPLTDLGVVGRCAALANATSSLNTERIPNIERVNQNSLTRCTASMCSRRS